jgi:predicted dehydrogenase
VTVEVSCVAPAHRRELRVLFEGGVAHLDGGWAEHLTIDRGAGDEPERRSVPGELPLLAELRAFVRFAAGDGPPPRADVRDGLEVVRRIEELGALATVASGAPA